MAVSYTHLDVYKRQGESFASLTKRALNELGSIFEENPDNSNILIISHGGLIVSLLVYWLKMPPEKWSSIIPVSYTHLDVYKRQIL